MRSGRLYEQPTWEPPTVANGCSSWPTPTAVEYGSSQNGSNGWKPSAGTPSLHTLARSSSWPTPISTDGSDASGGAKLTRSAKDQWPTPLARDGSTSGGPAGPATIGRPSAGRDLSTVAGRLWSTPLATETHAKLQGAADGRPRPWPNLTAMALWPTPTTTDSEAAARGTTTATAMHSGSSLTDALRASWAITAGPLPPTTRRRGRGGPVLDPRFVEALMGFPDGYTQLDSPKRFDELASELLATRSSRSRRSRPSSTSSLALFDDEGER